MKKLLLVLLALVGLPQAYSSSASFSKSLSAVDSAITMDARGFNSVAFQLTGTWNATVKFEGTVNGSTWTTVYAVNQKGGAVDSIATANGVYLLSGNGFQSIRARVSVRTSGTVAVQGLANEGSGVVSLLNQSSAGASSNVAVTTSALPTGAATSTKQSDGTQKTQVVDGSGNVIGSTSNALDVNIKSGASSGAVAQGSTTSGQTGGLTQAAVTTAAPSYTTGQTSPLSLTTGGALRVDAGTLAAHPVTQSGTWTVQPGNTANTTAWLVTGTGGTFPVTAASLPLPTGAATSAKQPALGTAGSPSTDVISVQGVASGTAMPISAASLPLPSTAATSTKQSDGSQKTQIVDGSGNVISSTSNNLNVQCANCSGSGVSTGDAATFTAGSSLFAGSGAFYQTTATSNALTSGQQGMLQATANRALFVNPRNSSGTEIATASNPYRVDPTGTTAQPASQSGTWNITNVSGTVSLPTGAATAAKQPALGTAGSASTDVITVQGIASMTALKVDGSAVTQPVSGTITANIGTSGSLALDATLGRAQGSTTSGQTGPLIQGAVTTAAPSYTTAQTSPLSLTTGGALRVDASAANITVNSHAVTNAGTFAVQAGQAAHAAAVSGNPVRAGGRARTSDYTAVTNDQTADLLSTVEGKLVTQPIAIRASTWNYAAAAGGLVSTTGVTAKAAAGAGIRNCVDAVDAENEHATTSTEIVIRDGAAGTVLWRGWAQAAGGGVAKVFSTPLCGTANTLIEIAEVTATATTGVVMNLQGHITQE